MVKKLKNKKYLIIWYGVLEKRQYLLLEYDRLDIRGKHRFIENAKLIKSRGERFVEFNSESTYYRIWKNIYHTHWKPNIIDLNKDAYAKRTFSDLEAAELAFEVMED